MVPFFKSPFLKEDIQVFLKNLLEDIYFKENYIHEFEQQIKNIKSALYSKSLCSLQLAFSIALDLYTLKKGDTLLVSELFPAQLQIITQQKGIVLEYLPCNEYTLALDLPIEIPPRIKAIYIDYITAYHKQSLLRIKDSNIPIIINDSSFWKNSHLYKDIKTMIPENAIITITEFGYNQLIHLGGEIASIQVYSQIFLDKLKEYILEQYTPPAFNFLLGIQQLHSIDVYLANRASIIKDYSHQLRYFFTHTDIYEYSLKYFYYKIHSSDSDSVKIQAKQENISIETLETIIHSIDYTSAKKQYIQKNTIFLPLYPTLSKEDITKICQCIKRLL